MPLEFVLHAQLAADTHFLGDFPLSRVLLMNDARYPWLILVPRRPQLKELTDLSPADQLQSMNELRALMERMQRVLNPDKMNFAGIGNLVPQLHLHLIARFIHDEVWPLPVWGQGRAVPYASTDRLRLCRQLELESLEGFLRAGGP